jgi:hypothetical protein
MDWRHIGEVLAAGGKAYNSLLNLCVWAKNSGGQGSFYRSQHELFFVFKNGKGKHLNNIQLGKFGRYRTNVWEYPGVRGLSQQQGEEGNLLQLHPTVKPVALVADAVMDCSARGDLILDAFLGSGSTVIAAERVGASAMASSSIRSMWMWRSVAGRNTQVIRPCTRQWVRSSMSSRWRRRSYMDNDERGYEVGFGKTPKETRFAPGRSGNPKGRPKGSKNLMTRFREISHKKITVKVDGRLRVMTKVDAMLTQLVNKAAAGDHKATKEVLRLQQSLPFDEMSGYVAPTIIVNFVKSRNGKRVDDDDDDLENSSECIEGTVEEKQQSPKLLGSADQNSQ